MDKQAIIEELKNILYPYFKDRNFDLVDIVYRYEGRDLFLRILADRTEGGITLEECARINKEAGVILDEKDIIQDRFILEVSSPGLDRPLTTEADFRRCINKKAKFFLKEMINGKLEWDGVICAVDEAKVTIEGSKERIEIPLSIISKAKQLF